MSADTDGDTPVLHSSRSAKNRRRDRGNAGSAQTRFPDMTKKTDRLDKKCRGGSLLFALMHKCKDRSMRKRFALLHECANG